MELRNTFSIGRIFLIIVSIVLAFSLVACNGSAKAPHFTLEFPESWQGRVDTQQKDDCTIVYADGVAVAEFAEIKNEPGAKGQAESLIRKGYSYCCSNYEFYYYFRLLAPMDKSLYSDFSQNRHPEQGSTDAIKRTFSYPQETEKCSAVIDEQGGDRFELKDSVYSNHRLGYSFQIPEEWKGQCVVIETPWLTYLMATDGNRDIPILSFGAIKVEDAQEELLMDSAELAVDRTINGYRYGVCIICEGFCSESVPLFYTDEATIAGIIDSFCILQDGSVP